MSDCTVPPGSGITPENYHDYQHSFMQLLYLMGMRDDSEIAVYGARIEALPTPLAASVTARALAVVAYGKEMKDGGYHIPRTLGELLHEQRMRFADGWHEATNPEGSAAARTPHKRLRETRLEQANMLGGVLRAYAYSGIGIDESAVKTVTYLHDLTDKWLRHTLLPFHQMVEDDLRVKDAALQEQYRTVGYGALYQLGLVSAKKAYSSRWPTHYPYQLRY